MEEKLKREALNEGHPRSPDGEVEKSKGPTAGICGTNSWKC